MRVQKWKIAAIVLAVVAGGAAYAWADVAATVNPGAIGWTDLLSEHSIGWRFFVDKQITITHLGLYDEGDNGLVTGHTMGIWRVKKTSGLQLERQVSIGPGGATEDHHVYVALSEPFTIIPDPVPVVIDGVEYYERWLVGVWSPAGNQDRLVLYPVEAATFDITEAGIIRFQDYTLKASSTFTYPWGDTQSSSHYGVNFRYTVPAHAEAGPDVEIYTSQKATSVINGTATHTTPDTSMDYRWLEGETVLQSWVHVADGAAPLDLSTVAGLSIGLHTLKLEVSDGTYTSFDRMQLTVSNTPPEGQPTPTSQPLEIGVDAVVITAFVADFDGDALNYQWVKDGVVLDWDTITPPAGGAPVEIDDLVIPAGDPRFTLGSNQVQFVVNDGVNPAVTETVTVIMQDTTAPTIAPTSSLNMLWPANGALIPITVWANGADNGGGGLVLTASVQCSEDDGKTEVDWYVDSIDNTAGTIALRLRAERSGSGDGRVYTVTITATDASQNQSTAKVDVRVPHDKRKK